MDDDDLDEAELVKGLKLRDQLTQRKFITQHQDRVVEFTRVMFPTLSEVDVEEIVTDRLYFFIENPQKIDLSRGKLKNLLLKSIENKAKDLIRRQERQPELVPLDSYKEEYKLGATETDISLKENTITSISPDVLQNINEMMRSLTKDESTHLGLRVVENIDPRIIAQYLGITENNERVRWNRLLKKVKNAIFEYPALRRYAKEVGIDIAQ